MAAAIDPEGLLRSALEKIVFFECRVSQLESELAAARTTAERARADAAKAHRREVELEQAAAAERGARADAQAQADDLVERVRLLEGERERLLSGLVERARIGGAPGADGAPGPEEGGADLAGFIAELRAEIDVLRAWKAAAEAGGVRVDAGGTVHVPKAREGAEAVAQLAGRFEAEGRVGLSGRDTDRMKELLATRADRVLYERSMDDLRAPDARTRQRAVRTLEALGSKAAAPLLAAALGREEDGDVKAALLGALARFKEPFAAPLAERALEDARPAVRVAALEALNAVASGDAEPRLAGALSDPSPIVRRRAALLLGFAPGERAEAALSVALGDPDRGVARAAAAALSGRPTARAQGALARALEHPDASVRRAAASSLSRVSGERISSDGSAPARRAASRRIAERLAAMDATALRDAVIAGADALAPARPSTGSGRADSPARHAAPSPARAELVEARPHAPARSAAASPARAGPVEARPLAPAARAAVAVAVVEAAPADPGLEAGIVGEVRIALRGCTPADLSAVLGAPQPRVDAVLAALAARGALVQRGARWFMA
ncbi:HEAT repeat domain-containing protein [Anaeromyxobacter dehalogenans]|uniref:HEAT repeat domain-containing protein n=1 Tax=Anaeromyxobacter dehalogenans TaxID=161493 RepID=UPI0002D2C1DE|nr:HEAT repeat domain-containing protein [Anaeromyxobacter dehalogenans]